MSLISNFRCTKGFTLIELMVAVALLGILMALGIPAYREMIQNTMIRGASESIQNGIQQARIEAVKRNQRVRFSLGANSAWSIGCVTVSAACPAVITQRSNKEGSSTNITVTATPAGATTLEFDGLGAVLAAPPAAAAPFTRLDIDNSALSSADSRDLRLTVNAGGSVRVCDPYSGLSASDPRKC